MWTKHKSEPQTSDFGERQHYQINLVTQLLSFYLEKQHRALSLLSLSQTQSCDVYPAHHHSCLGFSFQPISAVWYYTLALRLSSNRAQTQSSLPLTYVNLSDYDVSDAAQHSHKVKHIPGIFQVILRRRELERSFGDRLERLTISHSYTGTFYCALKD